MPINTFSLNKLNSNKRNFHLTVVGIFITVVISIIGALWGKYPTELELHLGHVVLFLTFLAFLFYGFFLYNKPIQLREKFDKKIFEKHLNDAKKICILNTFAPNFNDEIREILIEALDDDITVEVLLWNPFCEEVQFREETLPDVNISELIRQNINFLQEIYNEAKNKNRLELRLYDSWAPFSLYSSDQGASIGFYMNGTLAVEGPQLVISTKTPSFDKFMSQFNKIWKTGKQFDFSKNNWQMVLDICFRNRGNSYAS